MVVGVPVKSFGLNGNPLPANGDPRVWMRTQVRDPVDALLTSRTARDQPPSRVLEIRDGGLAPPTCSPARGREYEHVRAEQGAEGASPGTAELGDLEPSDERSKRTQQVGHTNSGPIHRHTLLGTELVRTHRNVGCSRGENGTSRPNFMTLAPAGERIIRSHWSCRHRRRSSTIRGGAPCIAYWFSWWPLCLRRQRVVGAMSGVEPRVRPRR